jgi:hypothetical protein
MGTKVGRPLYSVFLYSSNGIMGTPGTSLRLIIFNRRTCL